MLKETVQYMLVTALVLGLVSLAFTAIAHRISDSLNSSALLIEDPTHAR